MQLTIERYWDGTPAPAGERVFLELGLSQYALRLRVDAPYHADPAPGLAPGSCPRLWEFEVVE